MSTRCQLGFYEDEPRTPAALAQPDALIYQHSDGYPDNPHGILATLPPVLRTFLAQRGGWDPEYCAAYCLAQLMRGVTGHGVTQHLHSDIAYLYAIYEQGITVYTPQADGAWATMVLETKIAW